MSVDSVEVEFLIPGKATGPLLHIDKPVSFWGGVDLTTGELIEVGHPHHGTALRGTVLVGGSTKGSTAGPGALLELLHRECGPAGFLTFESDPVLVSAAKAMTVIELKPTPVAVVAASGKDRVLAWCREYRGRQLVLDADSGTASVGGR